MTSAQIEQVIRLQEAGKGYRTIASELGLSINSVKSWCRRHPVEETPVNGCKQCSAPLIQFPGKRKRIYCSDRCRYLWWAGVTGLSTNMSAAIAVPSSRTIGRLRSIAGGHASPKQG